MEKRERGWTYSGVVPDNVAEALVIWAVDAEDGTGGDGGIDVGGAVEWVKNDDVVAGVALFYGYWHIFFFRCYNPCSPA